AITRKYNTLIQAQARELSHLRQRMREGRGVCHILTQHLGDTTKAFEELLRANDIDYYMGQSFREQLAQSSSLAQRVSAKISDSDKIYIKAKRNHYRGHLIFLIPVFYRLSKELQYKDKIIESLHTKLQQCPETPSSCHAPSETTDQSDRTSFVSDERCSTNEELELCSDMDAGSEFVQEERSCLLKSGVDLIEEHLREIRSLRQHLEDTIRTNDRLRQQLEDRLADTGRDGGKNLQRANLPYLHHTSDLWWGSGGLAIKEVAL
uniref:Uncharacterized protein n=1 Tax=Denticeps clupeoides TaxID=299321 RepID=A0AAY4EE11_9TELE